MALFDSFHELNDSRTRSGRRRFLFGAAGAAGAYLGYRWWRDRPRPVAQRKTAFVTPNENFYTVALDAGFRPAVARDDWRLEVSGPTGRFALSYDELLQLERRRVYQTFMCVGNEVGGPAAGNAEWTATPLAPLLARVLDERREGLRAAFYALDGFYSSVPLAAALSAQAFIAYEMNGVPLPVAHGFPARVLLPGVYGMKQPRWLEKIEITARGVSGYWEKRGWCGVCDVRMTARIDAATAEADGNWLVTGMAYCGAQAVGLVEVSFDDGATWRAATFTSERWPDAWATWEYAWRPARNGAHTLTARVLDSAGAGQSESSSSNFPAGATGLHRVTVKV